jgi:flagellar hook-associated protein 2
MAGISFTGIASGLNIPDIVDAIVGAQKVPYESRAAQKQGDYTTDISAVGSLKASLEDVSSAFDSLSDIDEYQQRSISGRDDFVGLSSDKDAEVGNYSVKVNALASNHKIMSSAINDSDFVGEGTLSISSGDNDFDIIVSDSAKLTDIRDAINDNLDNNSVSATIITDSSGQHLILNSNKTGLDNAITVSVAEASNKLTSQSIFEPTDTVGAGTLSFGAGDNNFDITIDASASYIDLVKAINDSTDNTSIVAKIVTGPTGEHLVFNSIEPGSDNAITVSANDDDGNNTDVAGVSQFTSANMDVFVESNSDTDGLSRLAYEATNKLTSTKGFTDVETVGSGSLSFAAGDNAFTVAVSSFFKLENVMQAINNNQDNTSIKASIVNDATGDHLVFSSRETGVANAISVTATDDDGDHLDNSGISQFIPANMTATANIEHLNEVDSAADAEITIDGVITVRNSTNVFKDVIDGVEITANKVHDVVGGDDLSKVKISEDNKNVAEGLTSFIEKFNALVDLSEQLGRSSKEEGVGALAGDSLLRGVMTKIRSQFNKEFDIGGGETLSLSQLGVRTERSGKLSLDDETLDDYIAANPDKVQNFLIGKDQESGFVTSITEFINFYTDSDGLIQKRIDGKTNMLDRIADDLVSFNEKMDSLEARLLTQYNGMDLLVSQLNSTSSYLMSQLDNLPGVVKKS